jgi:O-antigen/teichoic acid export membrane protein
VIKRHAFIYLFAHGIPAALGLITFVVYTHLMSPAEYGFYVIGTTAGGIISAIAFMWIRFSVTRYQSESADADVRATALSSFAAALSVIGVALAILAVVFHNRVSLALAASGVLYASCSSAFEIALEFRRARLEPAKFFRISLIRSVFGSFLGVGAALLNVGGVGVLAANSVSYIIGFFLPGTLDLSRPIEPVRRTMLTKFLTYGMPFALSGILYALCNSLDRLIVVYYLGEAAAGTYGAAGDLARQTMILVSMSVASAIFPLAFRRLRTEGQSAATDHLAEGIELLAAVVCPIAVLLMLSADQLANTIIGVKFADELRVLLPILVVARLFGSFSVFYVHISFQLAEKPLLQIINGGVAVTLTMLLMFFSIPRFGLIGAAAASVLSEAGGLIFGIWLTKYGFRVPWALGRLARVSICLAVMGGAIYLTKGWPIQNNWLRLVATLISGCGTYAITAFLLDVARIRSFVLARRRM